MNTLDYYFVSHEETNTIEISKKLSLNLDQLWTSWSEYQYLERWIAPSPYSAHTKEFLFETGGFWLYYMESPEGDKNWYRTDYSHIDRLHQIRFEDGFCDENGVIDEEKPSSKWVVDFIDDAPNGTQLKIKIQFPTTEAFRVSMEMGLKEGMEIVMNQLDKVYQT